MAAASVLAASLFALFLIRCGLKIQKERKIGKRRVIDRSKNDIENESLASLREIVTSTGDVGPTKDEDQDRPWPAEDEDQDRPYRSWNDLIEIDKIEIEVVNEM